MWRRQMRDLAPSLRCIAVDLPGHGDSVAVPWQSLDETAKQVTEVIESKADGRANLVGLSLGGYVAARLAAAAPELVASAIVSGISVLPGSVSKRMWRRSQLMMQYTTFAPVVKAKAEAYGVPDEDMRGFRLATTFMSRQALARMGEEILDFTIPLGAKETPCPVLAMAGERESELVMRSLPLLADGFARGEARYAPDTGHKWNGEAPELFNATVRSWVTDQRLPPRLRDPQGWVR